MTLLSWTIRYRVEIRIETAQNGLETKKENEIDSEDFPRGENISAWKAYRARELARVEESYLKKLMDDAGNDIQTAMDISGPVALPLVRAFGPL